jgi:ribose transport system substrate-binding protein
MAKLLGGRGEVALMLIPGHSSLLERVQGYREALKKYPDIKIVVEGNDGDSQVECAKECQAILHAHPNLAGFGCVDAIGGQGAAEALKLAGRAGKVKIVAMDRDDATLLYIKQGLIDVSIAQRTYLMSYMALQMLYDLHNNRIKFADDWRKLGVNPLPREVDTGTFIITKENVDSFRRDK